MKLRNYSSGMKVRLAFAIMVEVDGDVMMIDEVLAVGDSAFQRKSRDVFQNYKDRGKTVILVSHQMTAIQELCDRCMLLEGGRIERIGDPYECARRYSELAISGTPARDEILSEDVYYPVNLADIWIGDLQGDTTPLVSESEDLRVHAVIETKEAIENATFRFEIRNQNRARIFSPPATDLRGGERIEAGERLHIEATVETASRRMSTASIARSTAATRATTTGRSPTPSQSTSRSPGTDIAARACSRSRAACTSRTWARPAPRPRRSSAAHDVGDRDPEHPSPRGSRPGGIRGRPQAVPPAPVAYLEDRAPDPVPGSRVRHGLVGGRAAADIRRLYAVFSSVARFGGLIPHYPAMLLMNIMLYRAIFQSSTGRATLPSWRGSPSSANAVPEDHHSALGRPHLDAPVHLADAVVLLVFFFINGVPPMWTWLLFPVIVLSFLILTIGMSLLLSEPLRAAPRHGTGWGVISLMFFYGSPVIFPVNAVPSSLRSLLFFMNPFVPMLEQARIWMINPTAPPITLVVKPGPRPPDSDPRLRGRMCARRLVLHQAGATGRRGDLAGSYRPSPAAVSSEASSRAIVSATSAGRSDCHRPIDASGLSAVRCTHPTRLSRMTESGSSSTSSQAERRRATPGRSLTSSS